jgi:dTDP-4-amino-4,6-dideoxygalactose transaminase
MPEIPFLDLTAQYESLRPEIDAAVQRVLQSGHFILGPEVKALETEIAAYLGVQHAVGLASGTDALILALRALEIGPGDEVILPAYTFFATAGAVLHVGATPVLVDVDPQTYCLDVAQAAAKITPRTRAIIPVHLYGHPADMEAINGLARQHNLKVIEDNAQAFGAEYSGAEYQSVKTGALGDVGCLSFFPTKNLGGAGDGGMLVTRDAQIADRVRRLRAHGWKDKYFPLELGYNSRLDALQAALLRVKLPHVDAWNDQRRELAAEYTRRLQGLVGTPYEAPGARHVYHLYMIRSPQREALGRALHSAGVACGVYYPQPLHLAEPLKGLGYAQGDFPESERASLETLAIPLFPEMSLAQLETVVEVVRIYNDQKRSE